MLTFAVAPGVENEFGSCAPAIAGSARAQAVSTPRAQTRDETDMKPPWRAKRNSMTADASPFCHGMSAARCARIRHGADAFVSAAEEAPVPDARRALQAFEPGAGGKSGRRTRCTRRLRGN